MRWLKRLLTAVILAILSLVLILSAAFIYLITTPVGGKLLVRYFKQTLVTVGLMHVGHYQGSLQEGVILKDVVIKGLSYLPDAVLRIQEVDMHLPLWQPSHAIFRIFNARLLIPNSDPVVFNGRIYEGQVTGNVYAKSVDIHEASRFFTDDETRKYLRGYISNVDLILRGSMFSPRVTGSFLLDTIRYRTAWLSNTVARADLILIPDVRQLQLQGLIGAETGRLLLGNVNMLLATSRLFFQGDVYNPRLEIRLTTRVEDMDIHLTVSGNYLKPQLTVTSDPPMPPQDALRVLMTGNAWSAAAASPFSGVSSGQLSGDFLNYSLSDINTDQQLGLRTKLSDNLKLGFEMDQMQTPPGYTNTYYSRKINGEMALNEHMSLNVSQEVLPQYRDPSQSAQDAQPDRDTQIYLQYKKRF